MISTSRRGCCWAAAHTAWTIPRIGPPARPSRCCATTDIGASPRRSIAFLYRIIDNDLARLTSFRNGEIDIYGDALVDVARPEPYQKLLNDPTVLARTQHFEYDTPTGGYRFIGWNEQRNGKPTVFADKRVRQAMTMMIDRPRICSQIMRGYVIPVSGPFYVHGKQNNPSVQPWPFDVARAKALLKEAGFIDDGSGVLKEPDGTPFQFKMTYPRARPRMMKWSCSSKTPWPRPASRLFPIL